jgi:hypothetical protein
VDIEREFLDSEIEKSITADWNGREMREEKLIQTTTGPAYIDIPPTIRVPWFRGIVWQAWLVGIGLYAAAGYMLYAIFVRPWLR